MGAYPLAAEVIDNEYSADGFHLKRSLVVLGMRIKIEIQHVQRQLAASNDIRPPAADPAWIVFQLGQKHGMRIPIGSIRIGCRRKRHMSREIENLDDVSVRFDGIRDINRLLERAHESLGDGGFAISRGPVHEHRYYRVRCRSEPSHDTLHTHQLMSV